MAAVYDWRIPGHGLFNMHVRARPCRIPWNPAVPTISKASYHEDVV